MQPATVAADASQPLHFKPEPAQGTGIAAALVVTVLLLGAATALLALAKKKGWLKQWSVQPQGEMRGGLAMVQRLRLSPRTMVFRLQDGERQILVVESTANVTVRDV